MSKFNLSKFVKHSVQLKNIFVHLCWLDSVNGLEFDAANVGGPLLKTGDGGGGTDASYVGVVPNKLLSTNQNYI